MQSNIWSYWEGIALDHVRLYIRERKGAFAFPASDGTVLVAANLMHDEFVAARRDRGSKRSWREGRRGRARPPRNAA